jgi:hypothetical protein
MMTNVSVPDEQAQVSDHMVPNKAGPVPCVDVETEATTKSQPRRSGVQGHRRAV